MTEAKSDSWNREGAKEDFKMEELLMACVADEVFGFAAEEIFDDNFADAFLLPMLAWAHGYQERAMPTDKSEKSTFDVIEFAGGIFT